VVYPEVNALSLLLFTAVEDFELEPKTHVWRNHVPKFVPTDGLTVDDQQWSRRIIGSARDLTTNYIVLDTASVWWSTESLCLPI